jgi:EpsI family protein
MTSLTSRFGIVAVVLAGTSLFINTRVGRSIAPKQVSVESLPLHLGEWNGVDVPVPPATLNVLHGATILERAYFDQRSDPEVYLYIAYYPNQHAGDRRHLPEDCLFGSGWSATESGATTVFLPGQKSFPANRFLIAKAGQRQLVLYWFWARGRGAASQSWADAYLVLDSLRLNRSDDALIRLNTLVLPKEEGSAAERRLLSFAAQVVPAMGNYFPR